jgi:hypothetical protein
LRSQDKNPEQVKSDNIEKLEEEYWNNYLKNLDEEGLKDILKYSESTEIIN